MSEGLNAMQSLLPRYRRIMDEIAGLVVVYLGCPMQEEEWRERSIVCLTRLKVGGLELVGGKELEELETRGPSLHREARERPVKHAAAAGSEVAAES